MSGEFGLAGGGEGLARMVLERLSPASSASCGAVEGGGVRERG